MVRGAFGDVIPTFSNGHAVVGVTSTPFKCPPDASEAAPLLHDQLVTRGVRDACEISLVMSLGTPVPPSPATSEALLAAFAERDITFVPNRLVSALDPRRRVAVLDDRTELPYDLFLGVTKHHVPDVVAESGLTEDGWIPIDPKTLMTRFPGVYAVGDVTSVGTPKTGVFSEGAAKVVAASLIAESQGNEQPPAHGGAGSCHIGFGGGRGGRADVIFPPGGSPTGSFAEPSIAVAGEKRDFGSSHESRGFGLYRARI